MDRPVRFATIHRVMVPAVYSARPRFLLRVARRGPRFLRASSNPIRRATPRQKFTSKNTRTTASAARRHHGAVIYASGWQRNRLGGPATVALAKCPGNSGYRLKLHFHPASLDYRLGLLVGQDDGITGQITTQNGRRDAGANRLHNFLDLGHKR